MTRSALRLAVVPLLLLLSSTAALAQLTPPAKASLGLAADRTAYEPGERAHIAAVVEIEPGWHIQSHWPSLEYLIPTVLHLELPEGWPEPEVDYPPHVLWQASFEAEELAVYDGRTVIEASFDIPADAQREPLPLEAVLEYQACDDRVCLQPTEARATLVIDLAGGGEPVNEALFAGVESTAPAGDGPPPEPQGRAVTPVSLAWILLLGVVGGLILNAMPCVLPVLSLKIFGLVQSAAQGRREVTVGALATASGILVSFWTLAALAIGVRAAGGAVGWGIQFQNPVFVAFLAIVLVLFSLNLWGMFEIPLPRGIARLASGGSGQSLLGHFTTGLFATLMATPCSAPFLGTAVGFALAQPSTVTFAVFTAVGVGMALPYLLLAIWPGTAAWLPKPGAWMEQLKGVMGFLLAGTVVWLLYVLSGQISSDRLALLEGSLVALALFAWLRSSSSGAQTVVRTLSAVGVVASMLATLWIAQTSAGTAVPSALEGKRIAWRPFDRLEAERLPLDENRLVFVDVTADWCATCKVNERLVLETETIADLFERHDVIAMKADWTNRDDEIARYLAEFGRYAIPFYVLYRPGAEPHVFGELLSREALVDVVESSAAAVLSGS